MLALGSLAFASPWLLVALAALPIIWWLLRVTPPAPRRIAFPAIRLLLGLVPREETPARTPLWLILLRMALAALVIFAVAHPLLNPQARLASTGPILVVIDDGWAAARDWPARQAALADLLAEAEREDRQVVLVTTAPPATSEPSAPLAPIRAADARAAVQAMQPKPWPVDRRAALARLKALSLAGGGLRRSGSATASPTAGARRSPLISPSGAACATSRRSRARRRSCSPPATREANDLGVVLRSLPAPAPRLYQVRASGEDGRLLARQAATIEPGCKAVEVRLPMPSELRNRTARIEVEGDQSAGSVLLVDERWRRRPVGIAAAANAGSAAAAQRELLSRARTRPVRRDPSRPRNRSPQARARRPDIFGYRTGFAGGGSGGRQMDRGRRAAAALCRAAPRRAGRRAVAGAAAPRRPHDRRCAVLGAAGKARSVRARQPVRRARRPGGRDGFAPGPGRAGSRPRGQDLGAASRRHPARHRGKTGTRLDRARPHDGERRLVEPRLIRPVRRDAAAHRGDEPGGGGGERGGAAADRDPRRVWPAAARPADRPPDPRQGDRIGAAHRRSIRPASTARPTPSARSTSRPGSPN